ncbi:MAG: glutamate--tRNA ligase [Rhodospirillaceae bacterium]|jgi:glutamyl-tRNA synthetase|nr:glutamate--tRNA ligase [Rhodospirillaceae bacterium]MBT6512605.1 glutamate--tRNA ligase [Rhodospirillaceae bacterium]
MSPAVTRFAPSPTGRLHVGNIRAALMNWMVARQTGGSFILRLDDTDAERSTDAFADGIRADMAWLGLEWDREERQSERFSRYEAARAAMAASGRLYPCYETPQELKTQRNLHRAKGLPPVYDRSALKLSDAERTGLESEGREPHWRFRLGEEVVAFDDLIRGPVSFEPGHVSDPVLVRADGIPTYTLASVVDDMEMGVTLVVRGEDHVANTAVQIELMRALGGDVPGYANHPFLTSASGDGLSKRKGGAAIADLRDQGIEPLALTSYLARIGTSHPIEPLYALADMTAGFSFETISRNPPRYDPDEVFALNAKWLHGAPFVLVADQLPGLDAGFWEIVRGNVERATDALEWWRICREPIEPVISDPDFAIEAANLLPDDPWDATTWKTWTQAVKETTGRKGRELFMPLRQALTGLDHGPELAALLPIIGRERVLARLGGQSG